MFQSSSSFDLLYPLTQANQNSEDENQEQIFQVFIESMSIENKHPSLSVSVSPGMPYYR